MHPSHILFGVPRTGPALGDLDGLLAWGGNPTPRRGPSSRPGSSRPDSRPDSQSLSSRGGGLGATCPTRPLHPLGSPPGCPLLAGPSLGSAVGVGAMHASGDSAAGDVFFGEHSRSSSSGIGIGPQRPPAESSSLASLLGRSTSAGPNSSEGQSNRDAGQGHSSSRSGGVVLKLKLRKTGRAFQLAGGGGRVAAAAARPEQVQARAAAKALDAVRARPMH